MRQVLKDEHERSNPHGRNMVGSYRLEDSLTDNRCGGGRFGRLADSRPKSQ